MKFKNYVNSHTGDNRIYSLNDITQMPLGDVLRNKEELLSQYRELGVPTESELQNSENVVYVHAYTRDDGTKVRGYWRSRPECSSAENSANKQSIKNDADKLSNDVENNSVSKDKDTKYIKPVEGKITSDFGYRTAPVAGSSTNHSGIDIGVPVGTPVKAMADGTVVAANGGMKGYGNGVFIDHGYINGKHVRSEYGHLSKFEVKVGDKVKQGQIVAESGNTGVSEGPHLHLTIREYDEEEKTWKAVDPRKYLKY